MGDPPSCHPLTSPEDWDPTVLDSDVPETWYDAQSQPPDSLMGGILTEEGSLKDDEVEEDDEYFDTEQYFSFSFPILPHTSRALP